MRYEFRISLTGDRIEVATLKDALVDLLKLLKSVEKKVAAEDRVRWSISTLSYASPMVIGCVGEPRSRKRHAPDCSPEVGAAVLAGLQDLEAGNRPTTFTDDALEAARSLAALRDQRGVSEVLIMAGPGRNGDRSPVRVTPRTLAAVDDFIGVRAEGAGSVEGHLEVISAHGGVTCNVYELLTGKPVRCHVPDHLKQKVLAAFEQRVIAHGIVKRDSGGQARQLVLRDIEPVPEPQHPFESLAGIYKDDFPEGTDSAEYIKARWK